ncbi:hypothetical protein [Streptomyces minutiscleroticus]|uniref:Lipoprotein n=1 Tax=Streptomyces minutiscleroticus TaxID=68238 RepID=A0A918NXI4_9ACTN|nr:hypothetical protein [Streptomyces minutiscleroticus]GGY03820.1 lipoprotein [Streptomyces minutiscleroticus]
MRPVYVPVRLAAAALAVAAASGCVSVGNDEGGGARPAHPAGQRGGAVPDGGSAVTGGGPGYRGTSDGKRATAQDGVSAPGPASSPRAGKDPSASASRPAGPDRGDGGDGGAGPSERPSTAGPRPAPTRTAPSSTSAGESPSPSPDPTVAEPSSSAHEETTPQLAQRREPAPRAGAPA